MLTGYGKVVNYILETYATDDVIAERDAQILRFTHPSIMMATKYTKAKWNHVLRCKRI